MLTHNQEHYEYRDLIDDVVGGLRSAVETAIAVGVPREHIIIDPGIGFGKDAGHNLEILRSLDEFKTMLALPLLIGTSRTSFIGLFGGGLPPTDRLEGTSATVALAVEKGADIVRVHDVRQMVRVCRMSDAVVRG